MEYEAGGSCHPDPDQPGGGEEDDRDPRVRGQGSRNDGPRGQGSGNDDGHSGEGSRNDGPRGQGIKIDRLRGQSSRKDDGPQDQSSSKDGPHEDRDDKEIDSRRFLVSSGLASPLSLLRDYLQTNSSVMPRELVDQGEAEYESNVI